MVFDKTTNALDRVSDTIVAFDNNGKINFTNEAFVKVLGLEKSGVLGKNISELYPRQVYTIFYDNLDTAMAKKEIKIFEWENQYSHIFWETTFFPSADGITAVGREITDRKKVEKTLSESEQLYKMMFDNSEEGFVLVQPLFDETGEAFDFRFLKINHAYERQTGRRSAVVEGKRATEVAPDLEREWITLVGKTAKTGKPSRYENFNKRTNKWYDSFYFLFMREQVGILFRDVTNRKITEQTLNNKQNELNHILDSSPTIIFYKDINGKFIQANRAFAEALNTTKEALLGKTVFDLYSAKIAQSMASDDHVVLESKRPKIGIEEQYESPTGLRWIRTDKIPSFDENGNVNGLIGFSEDITEHKALERRLQENERLVAIGQTAGMVGHDIRNPLQAIMSDVFLIKSELSINQHPDLAESLCSIEQNIGYINKIVADLQDYARPLKPEYSQVDLSEIMTNVVKDANIGKDIKVVISANTFAKMRSEPTFIRRVLTNLVNNAIQAMPKGGELELTCFAEKEAVSITVADTGVGIPHDVKARLFTPMMTTKAKGQGLGLAVAKRLVEALNGTISFESQEGKGTKFIIQLPIAH